MLTVFIKSVMTFILVLIVVRLMGKRQIGEMQPFELVITLIIAEVACIPMNDPYIPFYAGIIPIITLAALEITISALARKSLWLRKLISGQSVIAIDKNGINYENLKKLNINMNDLLEAARSGGYTDFNEIEYAIFETNGKLCVLEKPKDPTALKPVLLPIALIIDGTWTKELETAGLTREEVLAVLKEKGIKNLKEILYADVRQDGSMYISPKHKKYINAQIEIKGGANW